MYLIKFDDDKVLCIDDFKLRIIREALAMYEYNCPDGLKDYIADLNDDFGALLSQRFKHVGVKNDSNSK